MEVLGTDMRMFENILNFGTLPPALNTEFMGSLTAESCGRGEHPPLDMLGITLRGSQQSCRIQDKEHLENVDDSGKDGIKKTESVKPYANPARREFLLQS